MRYDVQHIDILSVVRTVFVISWVASLLVGFAFLLFSTVVIAVIINALESFGLPFLNDWYPGVGLVAALFGVTITATLWAVFVTIVAIVSAALYNALAGWWGGVSLELEETPTEPTPSQEGPQPARAATQSEESTDTRLSPQQEPDS